MIIINECGRIKEIIKTENRNRKLYLKKLIFIPGLNL